jgi:hypothetical protein
MVRQRQATGTPRERFVQALYQIVLKRPGSSSEVDMS